MKKKSSKTIIGGLVVVIGGLLGYSLYSSAKFSSLEIELEKEKKKSKSELDLLVVEYDAKIVENLISNSKLRAAREDVFAYRDSLQVEKNVSSKNKIDKDSTSYLWRKNEELFSKVQDMIYKSDKLNQEILEGKEIIQQQELDAWGFANENELLLNKFAIASKLEISELKIISMKKSSNGSYKDTSRSKKTDSFKVSFEINANLIADSGIKVAYLIIKNPLGEVVTPSGKFLNGDVEFYYSEITTIDFENKEIEVIVMNDIDRKQTIKGMYTIKVALGDRIVGEATTILK